MLAACFPLCLSLHELPAGSQPCLILCDSMHEYMIAVVCICWHVRDVHLHMCMMVHSLVRRDRSKHTRTHDTSSLAFLLSRRLFDSGSCETLFLGFKVNVQKLEASLGVQRLLMQACRRRRRSTRTQAPNPPPLLHRRGSPHHRLVRDANGSILQLGLSAV